MKIAVHTRRLAETHQ